MSEELTPRQQHAFMAARMSADQLIQMLNEVSGEPLSEQAGILMRVLVMSAQLGMMRVVSQWSANERAEVARMETEFISARMEYWTRPVSPASHNDDERKDAR